MLMFEAPGSKSKFAPQTRYMFFTGRLGGNLQVQIHGCCHCFVVRGASQTIGPLLSSPRVLNRQNHPGLLGGLGYYTGKSWQIFEHSMEFLNV